MHFVTKCSHHPYSSIMQNSLKYRGTKFCTFTVNKRHCYLKVKYKKSVSKKTTLSYRNWSHCVRQLYDLGQIYYLEG